MNVITHALLPALVSRPLLPPRPDASPRWRALALIGAAGVMPDLLNPHLSLAARFASWSHTGWCWLAFTAAALAIVSLGFRSCQFGLRTGLLMSFAYLLHIACDAISGGVMWLKPWSDTVTGARWVPFVWWLPLDAVMLLAAYFVFRWWPKWGSVRRRPQS
jgi:hypothetical protein